MTRPLMPRSAGVLLHITSLPGRYGSGDLGPDARAFLAFLEHAGQSYWQTLPVNPVGPGYSPYSGRSSFAGNPLLISLDDLIRDEFLREEDVETLPEGGPVDYPRTEALRISALRRAHARFTGKNEGFEAFRSEARNWLPDYALYSALRDRYPGEGFLGFPRALLHRDHDALSEARKHFEREISYYEFEQWLFDRQWRALREEALHRGLKLIGDLPIFVSHDSADVWAHQALFRLDAQGRPTHVSGVPPDAFSATGQRWGTPVYRWRAHERSNFAYWVERIRCQLARFDLVRLDHFIGFARSWTIPAEAETAMEGRWTPGPSDALFAALRRALGTPVGEPLPLIAEDLGVVTPRVRALRRRQGLPGMRVLQFGFDPESDHDSEHLPHRYPDNAVVYTGTHDSDTIVGFLDEPGEDGLRNPARAAEERALALAYACGPCATEPPRDLHLAMIRILFASRARLAMVPMQDWLGLGRDARMNVPGQPEGNWAYRVARGALEDALAAQMREHTEIYGRSP